MAALSSTARSRARASLGVLIQTVVQHAGPARAHLLPRLLASLPKGTQVIEDPGAREPRRSPWRCYRACLEALEPSASHLLVIQEDALVCTDFPDALQAVVAAQPDDLLALHVQGAQPLRDQVLRACWNEQRWLHLDFAAARFVPLVATVWPRDCIPCFLDFVASQNYPASRTADDGLVFDWVQATNTRVLATVPSLVEHLDDLPSTVGTMHAAGGNPQRTAACWIGEELSPLAFQW